LIIIEFKLKPVDSIPEYLNVYCGFTKDNHDHLPIIWRNTYRSSYAGWASWFYKYGMVNFYHLYNELIEDNNYNRFIDEFLRVYYHEYLHLFFYYRLRKVFFLSKYRDVSANEQVINNLAILIYKSEVHFGNHWAYELFEDVLNV
jgi:hypothetical protein